MTQEEMELMILKSQWEEHLGRAMRTIPNHEAAHKAIEEVIEESQSGGSKKNMTAAVLLSSEE